MIAVVRPMPRSRRLGSAASVAAVIAGTLGFAPQNAVAGDVTVSTDYSFRTVYGNSAAGDPTVSSGSASGNSLTLTSGAAATSAMGGLGTGTEDANDNHVRMSGGSVNEVLGGRANWGDATGNQVIFDGGTASSVTGGYSYGSTTYGGVAEHNTTIVNGGTVNGTVYGGWSTDGDVLGNAASITGGRVVSAAGGYSQNASARDNTLSISGGTFFYSGRFIAGGVSRTGSATDNTVTISGSPVFASGLLLYGGYCTYSCGDMFTGNRLELKTSGLSVASVSNFQYLDFYLPTTLAAGSTMLTVTGTADLTNGSGTSSIVNVGINGASSPLAVGDTVKLIHAGTLVTTAGLNGTATGSGMLGVTLAYTFDIAATSTDLTATVSSAPTVTDGSKALSEGFVSGASLINQGADLADGKGMAAAVGTAGEAWSTFGAVSGGSQRARTGSYVDLDSVSLMAGIARRFDLAAGNATAGLFAEYGSGHYDTFNRFASGVVRGHGDSHYFGGGLIGHIDFAATETGHAYAEATARLGAAHNGFESPDLVSGGVSAGYDASSFYAGASAALGHVWTLDPATTLDVGGRYLWSRLDGDRVRLTTGETVDFDAVTSQRTRLGARLSHTFDGGWTPFAGAAWEHEFDGVARATTKGLALNTPSLGGDTGILEAGLTLKPSQTLPLSLDVGVQGFLGRREGMAGGLQAKWTF